MNKYLIITENDESNWDDVTGIKYHYPSKYKNLIKEGCNVIYYKGKIKNKLYQSKRLTNEPHYFAIGVIKKIYSDELNKNNYYAELTNFENFIKPVAFKNDNKYLEIKANIYKKENVKGNYFRGNAVREITKEEYDNILLQSHLVGDIFSDTEETYEKILTTKVTEGKKTLIYTTKYERNRSNRDLALKIHGYNCIACNMNFKDKYGEIGEGFIHVHHIFPLYSLEEEKVVDPHTDLVPICPNCHAIIHRQRNKILSIEELKLLLKTNSK